MEKYKDLRVFPYSRASKSAKSLAAALRVPLLLREGGKYRGAENRLVINWGASDVPPSVTGSRMLNSPVAIRKAVNKLRTLDALFEKNVPTPDFTTDPRVARRWAREGERVVCRTVVDGYDGAGIVLASKPEEVVDAPLYTLFVPAESEYRITIAFGETVCRQKRVRRRDHQGKYNPDIRTSGGGYGFDVVPTVTRGLIPAARGAVEALGLDFGGVDVLLGQDGKAYVLEVNTAPEMTPACEAAFIQALKKKYDWSENV